MQHSYIGDFVSHPNDQFTYTAGAAPSVSSIAPSNGGSGGGNTVTLLGSGFTGASTVNFGSTAATSVTVLTDNALTATAPAGSVGTVDVTVVSPAGTSTTSPADQYSYTTVPVPQVLDISPTSGSDSGGTTVIVSGYGFTGATAVAFGGYAADFAVNSDGQLTAIAPAQPAGVVAVTVTTAGGTSSASSADQFTYTSSAAPTVTGVSPTSGPTTGGTPVLISGTGFTGATAATFGTTPAASFSVTSDGSITAQSPGELAGTVDVTVTTPNGTSATNPADHFTFQGDAPLTAVSGINISATTGSPFNGPVASFTDTDPAGTASQFSALIDWGNGQRTPGTVVANGYNSSGQPQFLVTGLMIYSASGQYSLSVGIQDAGGANGQAAATATVSNPPRLPGQAGPVAQGTTATATHGDAFRGGVATFSGMAAAAYRISINWGNGTTTAGSVVATGPNTFSVVGSNTYTAPGVYQVSITISMVGGGSTTVETTISVADASPAPAAEGETLPADDAPRTLAEAAELRREEALDEAFWDLGWLIDLGGVEEASLDQRCVDALMTTTAGGSEEQGLPGEEVEPAPAILEEAPAAEG